MTELGGLRAIGYGAPVAEGAAGNAMHRDGFHGWSGVSARRIGACALVAALVTVRVLVALRSVGSNDIFLWKGFADQIAVHGVAWMYSHIELFNHPPLMAYWAKAALALSNRTSIAFSIVFKIPGLLGDIGTGLLLWRIWTLRAGPKEGMLALAAYTFGLTSVLVSAHHGNTDGLCTFLCLLAVYCAERGRHFSTGLAIGAALNVKIIPLLLLPALVLRRRSIAQALRATAGLGPWILPFVVFLRTAPHDAYHHIFGYLSFPNKWGIPFILGQLGELNHIGPVATKIAGAYTEHSRPVLLGSVLLVALWGRACRVDLYRVSAAAFGLFLFFAAGFGVQYTIYLAPPLFAISISQGLGYSTIAGIFIALVYIQFWSGKLPADTFFTDYIPLPAAIVGLVVWLVVGGVVVQVVRESDWRRVLAGWPLARKLKIFAAP